MIPDSETKTYPFDKLRLPAPESAVERHDVAFAKNRRKVSSECEGFVGGMRHDGVFHNGSVSLLDSLDPA